MTAPYLHKCPWTIILFTLFMTLPTGDASAQSISTLVVSADTLDTHTPRGALLRAVAFPGWGQFYNRQYLKIPVVYLVIGGVTALALTLNDRYLLYRHAYQYKAWEERIREGETNPKQEYKGAYDRIAALYGEISSEPLRTQRDLFRRNRDLSYFGIGLVYGLSVLDAFVSAHLLDFDVGEDLTLLVEPYHGISMRAAVRLSF